MAKSKTSLQASPSPAPLPRSTPSISSSSLPPALPLRPLVKRLQRRCYNLLLEGTLLDWVVTSIFVLAALVFILGYVVQMSPRSIIALSRGTTCIEANNNIGGRDFGARLCHDPIDVVYTWVNGSDPVWFKEMVTYKRLWTQRGTEKDLLIIKKAEADAAFAAALVNRVNMSVAQLSELNETALNATNALLAADDITSANRYRDNDELKYSMRSLFRYTPWIRNIILVTNGQVPNWLDTEHPRVRVVTHAEIFKNKADLPVFSSPSIEMHLHRIPGVSKKFIYLNDDVFFGAETWPDDFFTHAQGQKVYLAWEVPKCSKGCLDSWLGDGYCDSACNTTQCMWDAGDCSSNSTKNRVGSETNYKGRYSSTHNTYTPPSNNAPVKAKEEVPPIPACEPSCPDTWLGDKVCDPRCECYECGWDGGDCGMDLVWGLPGVSVRVLANGSTWRGSTTASNVLASLNRDCSSNETMASNASFDCLVEKAKVFSSDILPSTLIGEAFPHVMDLTSVAASPSASITDEDEASPRLLYSPTFHLNLSSAVAEVEALVLSDLRLRHTTRNCNHTDHIGNSTVVMSSREIYQCIDREFQFGRVNSITANSSIETADFADQDNIRLVLVNSHSSVAVVYLRPVPLNDLSAFKESNCSETSDHISSSNATGALVIRNSFTIASLQLWVRVKVSVGVDSEMREFAVNVSLTSLCPERKEVLAAEPQISVTESISNSSLIAHPNQTNSTLGGTFGRLLLEVPEAGSTHATKGNRIAVNVISGDIFEGIEPFPQGSVIASLSGTTPSRRTPVGKAHFDAYHTIEHGKRIGGGELQIPYLDAHLHNSWLTLIDSSISLNVLSPSLESHRRLRHGRLLSDTYAESLVHTNRFISDAFGKKTRKVPAHMPHLIDIESMKKLEDRWPSEFKATSARRFRDGNDIQYAFAYFHFLIEGGAREGLDVQKYFQQELDVDGDGWLSVNELRTLASVVLQRSATSADITKLRDCLSPEETVTTKEDLSDSRSELIETKMTISRRRITWESLMNCEEVVNGLSKHGRFGPTHQEMPQNEVSFEMFQDDYKKSAAVLDGIRGKRTKFICINDDMKEAPLETRKLLQDFYESYFPMPCPVELSGGRTNPFLHTTPLRAWVRQQADQKLLISLLLCAAAAVIISVSVYLYAKRSAGRGERDD